MCATLYIGRPQQPEDTREAISLTRSFLYFRPQKTPETVTWTLPLNLDSCLLWADSRDTWRQLFCPFPEDSPTQNRQKVVLQRPCTQAAQVTGRWVSSAIYGMPYMQAKRFSADMRQLETQFSASSLPRSRGVHWWTRTALSHSNVGCTRVIHFLDLCGTMTVSQLIGQGFDPSPGTGSFKDTLAPKLHYGSERHIDHLSHTCSYSQTQEHSRCFTWPQ